MTLAMFPGHLHQPLARAADARAASQAVVDHLGIDDLRPSVYLERGGRLRCQALLGYHHLLDGFPPGIGVIGSTFAARTPSVLGDVRGAAHYLEAHEGVCAEVCFPVRCGERVIGVVNLEAPRPLTTEEIEEVERAAAALGDRIEELGGPPRESSPQRLLRHSITLAGEHDGAAIAAAVVAAAVDVTPLSSAMLLSRASEHEPFLPSEARGPLAEVLLDTPADSVAALAFITRAGCSAYTVVGARGGAAQSPGIETLRRAGATSLIVLSAGPDRILVVADEAPVALDTEHSELLELLAAQASVCLRTAASVRTLRTQAATDALTGIGHHASFHAALARAHALGAVGVLMIDIDAFKAFNDLHGHPEGDRVLRAIADALAATLRHDDALFRIGGDEFAAVLPGVDEAGALEIAERLHAGVGASPTALSVSIGAATAREGESAESLLGRADRALYAVKARGRDGVGLADADDEAPPAYG